MIAIIIGALAALTLFASTTLINRILGIDSETAAKKAEVRKERAKATRSVADYRAEKAKKRQRKKIRGIHQVQSPTNVWNYSSSGFGSSTSDRGENLGRLSSHQQPLQLSAQTILEEDDSSSPLE